MRPVKKRPRHRASGTGAPQGLSWILVGALALLGAACDDTALVADGGASGEAGGAGGDGGGGGAGGGLPRGPDGCLPDDVHFSEVVFAEVVGPRCTTCHNPEGRAKNTSMVYRPAELAGAAEHNFGVFREMALYDRDGIPLVVAKPTLQAPHEGGMVLPEGDPGIAILEEGVRRARFPSDCVAAEVPVEADLRGLETLDSQGALRRASLFLAERLPTEDEMADVDARGEAALEGIIDRLTREEAFYDRMRVVFNDRLLTDKYLPNRDALDLLNQDEFPQARWPFADDALAQAGGDANLLAAARTHSNRAISREAVDLMIHVMRQGKPFTEILTADYTVLNPFSARIYGVWDAPFEDALDPNEFREVRLPGRAHAGVLTTPMFLNRFPTTDTNRNRHRARIVFAQFLGTDVLAALARPLDGTSTVHNPTLNDPQCNVCHAVIDPVAGAFKDFNARGVFNATDSWFGDMLPPGYGERAMPSSAYGNSLRWLGQQIADDVRFDRSIVGWFLEALTGETLRQSPLPGSDAATVAAFHTQQRWIDRVGREFRLNGHDVREVIKAVVRSPWFRAENADGEPDTLSPAVAAVGDARPLTPELLSARIHSTLGLPWRRRPVDTDELLSASTFRLLYGGIDSDDVSERLTAYNAIMGSIQSRMSVEMGCRGVAYDFSRPPEQRRLFPNITIEDNPETNPEGLREGIVHLHAWVLGERLDADDPEIERTLALYTQVWREGRTRILAETEGKSLLGECRATTDFWTGAELEGELRIERDDQYNLRAWMAVLTYLLADHRFSHP